MREFMGYRRPPNRDLLSEVHPFVVLTPSECPISPRIRTHVGSFGPQIARASSAPSGSKLLYTFFSENNIGMKSLYNSAFPPVCQPSPYTATCYRERLSMAVKLFHSSISQLASLPLPTVCYQFQSQCVLSLGHLSAQRPPR